MALELKKTSKLALDILDAEGWTVERLATATLKELTSYKGIGRVTAKRAISEAQEIINDQGLEDAETLAKERYYQKTPRWKILNDWEETGLSTEVVALASAGALAILKDIEEDMALRLISKAQEVVNKRGLYKSQVILQSPAGVTPAASAAFPSEWLSGAVVPPPMGARVKRNFERAQEAYRKANK